MARQVVIEHEAYDFGDPPEWLSGWEPNLSKQYVRFYLQLRDPIKDGKTFTLRALGIPIGMSQTRAEEALTLLEENGFVTFDTGSSPARIIVRDVPELPDGEVSSQAQAMAVQTMGEMSENEVKAFLSYWNKLHYHYLWQSYDVQAGRDASVAKRLIKNVGLDTLKGVAKWYWANRNSDDPTDVGSFSKNYTELSREQAEYNRRRL